MNVAARVREIYEKHPYPASLGAPAANGPGQPVPMEWINAVSPPRWPSPRRILVAGCGTGQEAIFLRRRFPKADVVAVDFSARSIAAAREAQEASQPARPIRFLVADLTSRRFPEITGGDFDFVSCHGVLSYVPRPGDALRNLVLCIAPEGALYLGVNGAEHFSVRARQFLPVFGFDMAELPDDRRLGEVLELRDAILGSGASLASQAAGYLAGDLFGPLIHNLSLAEWIAFARAAGLHFSGSYSAFRSIRPALNSGLYRLLMPRSRAEVCEILETLAPSAFHPLVFRRRPLINPPWEAPDRLLDWRPALTGLYLRRFPGRRGSWNGLCDLKVKSPSTNTLMELCAREWELEILRQSNGIRSLRKILEQVSIRVPRESLCRRIYRFYQAILINLLPPASRTS